jgi:OmpA-OmpF porin, OOP family
MSTIMENLRDLASPAIVSALSQQTIEPELAVSKGLTAAIPAIASTIASRANDQGFVKHLADLAMNMGAAPHPEAIRALPSSPTGIDTTTPIGGWLSSLFGNNLSDVTSSIARYAGIRGSSAASLLSVAASLVLGYIGRRMRSDQLSVAGLADLLQGQRAQLAASLPTGFKMPELHAPYETARTAVPEKASTGWSAPLMALLAVLGIGGLIWWGVNKPVELARVDVAEPVSEAVGTSGALGGKFARTLPGNVTINIPAAGSTEDRLSMFLTSDLPGAIRIDFDRIEFESDSAVLTSRSKEQLDTIATILRAYPRANVTVAGHTDSVGNEAANLALSRARADSVAARLTASGVPLYRVRAKGYGSGRPMADNTTEAGRAKNRRVELEVVR